MPKRRTGLRPETGYETWKISQLENVVEAGKSEDFNGRLFPPHAESCAALIVRLLNSTQCWTLQRTGEQAGSRRWQVATPGDRVRLQLNHWQGFDRKIRGGRTMTTSLTNRVLRRTRLAAAGTPNRAAAGSLIGLKTGCGLLISSTATPHQQRTR